MAGLTPGRIVRFVFDEPSAAEVMRRRTTAASVAQRIKQQVLTADQTDARLPKMVPQWPLGAQAHIGNDVHAGDVCPAIVVATLGGDVVNLKVMLDGSDTYWARAVAYAEWSPTAESLPEPRTWHWMFSGQAERYTPVVTEPPIETPPVSEESPF